MFYNCSMSAVVPQAVLISHGVAGAGRENRGDSPASTRALFTAYFTANCALIPKAYDGSPVALERRTAPLARFGESGSRVVCRTQRRTQNAHYRFGTYFGKCPPQHYTILGSDIVHEFESLLI